MLPIRHHNDDEGMNHITLCFPLFLSNSLRKCLVQFYFLFPTNGYVTLHNYLFLNCKPFLRSKFVHKYWYFIRSYYNSLFCIFKHVFLQFCILKRSHLLNIMYTKYKNILILNILVPKWIKYLQYFYLLLINYYLSRR